MQRNNKNKNKDPEADKIVFDSVIDGLKRLYAAKMRPLESLYKFGEFHSPMLDDADIEAKPMVLLIGQYSTGKTTFIRYLLERDFPGMNIGPEPTTDRFHGVMYGLEDRIIPGNTAVVQEDKPFRALSRFGAGFLNKFQISQIAAPILERVMFVDTPGVLSGEKQRIGRTYDFASVIEWFAERADLILLLFDAHKLDISDEFKTAIETLRGHDDKIRVVLNKADKISAQQLLRVYGALMWSLGKVIKTPEVMRVYLGSFWDQPLANEETARLLQAEMKDLLTDLLSLPRNAAIRKVNELVKRARAAKVHAYIISHLKNEMPSIFGKESKQQELIAQLPAEFRKVQLLYQLPASDFPDIDRFRESLKLYDISKFPKLRPEMLTQLDELLSVDVPALMQQFPVDGMKAQQGPLDLNPFAPNNDIDNWLVWELIDRSKYFTLFNTQQLQDGKLGGLQAKQLFLETGLPKELLAQIWRLSDIDKDGKLDAEEFCLAMHLAESVRANGVNLPEVLPQPLIPPSKKLYF